MIVGTIAGLPAARSGLAAGDVITSVNGHAVDSPSDLQALLEPHHPGDKISISWTDSTGQSHTTTVTLANGPAA